MGMRISLVKLRASLHEGPRFTRSILAKGIYNVCFIVLNEREISQAQGLAIIMVVSFLYKTPTTAYPFPQGLDLTGSVTHNKS